MHRATEHSSTCMSRQLLHPARRGLVFGLEFAVHLSIGEQGTGSIALVLNVQRQGITTEFRFATRHVVTGEKEVLRSGTVATNDPGQGSGFQQRHLLSSLLGDFFMAIALSLSFIAIIAVLVVVVVGGLLLFVSVVQEVESVTVSSTHEFASFHALDTGEVVEEAQSTPRNTSHNT